MADFTVDLTGTIEMADAVRLEYTADFIAEYEQANVMDKYVQFKREIGAKSISLPRFGALTVDITPLNEREEVDSEALSVTDVLLTPKEHGKVVSKTRLSDLQTGGRSGRAAVQQVATNMSSTRNVLGIRALEATTNVVTANGGAENTQLATDVVTPQLLNRMYNKLRRESVPFVMGQLYVAFLHDDVIHDLRNGVGAGSWQDIAKEGHSDAVLSNAVGVSNGFIIVSNSDCLINADGGDTTVDTYHSSFLGYNGLGLAESMVPRMHMTQNDKMGRFTHISWNGVFEYKIIEPTAVYKLISASSIGENA